MKDFKDFKVFIAGIGEINVIVYLIYVCTGLAPLFHILIIGSEVTTGKIVLTILGILYVILLTIARIYRKFSGKNYHEILKSHQKFSDGILTFKV